MYVFGCELQRNGKFVNYTTLLKYGKVIIGVWGLKDTDDGSDGRGRTGGLNVS